jgi:hypothetical protein
MYKFCKAVVEVFGKVYSRDAARVDISCDAWKHRLYILEVEELFFCLVGAIFFFETEAKALPQSIN